MTIRPTRTNCLLPIALAALIAGSAAAQEKQKPAKGEMRVQVYPVAELVVPRPDYPYQPNELPTTGRVHGAPTGTAQMGLGGLGGMGGGFGGGGFGGMGGGGLGAFQVVDTPGQAGPDSAPARRHSTGLRFGIDDLVQTITSTIAPETWQERGGEAVITPLGGMLVIKQTGAAHTEITELLRGITVGGMSKTVTVEAHWLHLGPEDVDKLKTGDKSPAIVDPAVLKELAASAPGYRGRITCFSDQTVHIASGHRRTFITSAVPTVGFGSVGYAPQVSIPNVGLLLQVHPSLVSGDQAIVNLESTITRLREAGQPVRLSSTFQPAEGGLEGQGTIKVPGGETAVVIDRVNLQAECLATTIRVPLGKPVLVGGMTVVSDEKSEKKPAGDNEEPGKDLYLFLQLTAGE